MVRLKSPWFNLIRSKSSSAWELFNLIRLKSPSIWSSSSKPISSKAHQTSQIEELPAQKLLPCRSLEGTWLLRIYILSYMRSWALQAETYMKSSGKKLKDGDASTMIIGFGFRSWSCVLPNSARPCDYFKIYTLVVNQGKRSVVLEILLVQQLSITCLIQVNNWILCGTYLIKAAHCIISACGVFLLAVNSITICQ